MLPLLAKPVSRSQFVLGKYAGLAMTLVVNLSVMTLAFYAVLAYIDWITPEAAKAAWPAPALDPRMLLAIVLIVAELMLVTALALFFSIPLLILTLGIFYVILNGILLWAASLLIPGYAVSGLLPGILGSLVIAIINWIAGLVRSSS